MKNWGIGAKLTASIITLLTLTCAVLGVASYFNSYNALEKQVHTNLEAKAADISHYVEEFFKRTNSEVEAIAEQQVIREMKFAEQKAYLQKRLTASEDYLEFAIVDANGIAHYLDDSTSDLADREYIKAALAGETAMSDTLISRVTNEPVVMIATPIDTTTGEKALLLARIDGYFLSNVLSTITVGETGYAFLFNEEGTIQAHKDVDYVKNQMNFITEEQGSPEATAIETMLASDKGFYEFEHSDGDNRFVGYYTLTNGWTMAIMAKEGEMFVSLDKMRLFILISTFTVLAIGLVVAFFVSRSLSRPIRSLVKTSEFIGQGDFSQKPSAHHQKRHDELGTLARSLDKVVENMRMMITKVQQNSNNVNEASCELMGDVLKVTDNAKVIAQSIDEVERGSANQAHVAEESAHTMGQMAIGIQQVAEVAGTVSQHTEFIEQKIRDGYNAVRHSITQMTAIQQGTDVELSVIHQLQEESQQISLISRMITDISDQTNLLALNASIEAARAGEAGKGFAVVADEVRKLSEQTAHSAAQINTLIQNVQRYTEEAVQAAESGEENVTRGLDSIHQLEARFAEIVEAVTQIATEIEHLSGSAQEMSANTEEVSASIEEMSASVVSAAGYVTEVAHSASGQLETVDQMKHQAEHLSVMASELLVATKQFKL